MVKNLTTIIVHINIILQEHKIDYSAYNVEK